MGLSCRTCASFEYCVSMYAKHNYMDYKEAEEEVLEGTFPCDQSVKEDDE